MIQISQITVKRDANEVITGFSADFKAGTVSAIIGPNGSGKSTLLAAIAGDLPLVTGELKLAGSEVASYKIADLAKVRSVAPQQPIFNLAFTVREVMEMARSAGSTVASEHQALADLAATELSDRKVTELSGGERQRISVALALASPAPILLLDEPFAAQDSLSRDRIVSLLKQAAKSGKTVILVAHLPEAELLWCDQIIKDF